MRLPPYAIIGLVIMAVSEVLMLAHVEPFWSWHTPIAWSGYILFVDGLVRVRRGSSWLTGATAEFTFLALVSIPLWLIFEVYNRLVRNWYYINLPVSPFWRNVGYAWSFATIWPAIFETAELVATFHSNSSNDHHRDHKGHGVFFESVRVTPVTPVVVSYPLSRLAWASIVAGAAMLLWPIVSPSPYLAAPVWLGFIFLLDPLNSRWGAEAIWRDWTGRGRERLVNLTISGLICGVIWECWNYWARAKWVYTVPILPNLKIFEMPLPGYLGFPAFALECFTLYVAVRRWLWRGQTRPIGL
jgi:hypothetical protein